MSYDDYGWRSYVTVATRRRWAAHTIAKLKRSGRVISPVAIEGRKIAKTFWGESWCSNLEAYSDYANRLPRGRTYARNGSVIDLQIERGRVRALVTGSSLYDVTIEIRPLAPKRWRAITSRCAGKIDSLIELLQGAISSAVMEVVTRKSEGLFPAPRDISLGCSCPDWATMCKHVAAVLYGVGARLDHEPEMLFTLRGVQPADLIAAAMTDAPTTKQSGRRRLLQTDDVSSVFGIELDAGDGSDGDTAPRRAPDLNKPLTNETPPKQTPTKKTTTTRRAVAHNKPASRAKATKKSASTKSTDKKSTAGKTKASTKAQTSRADRAKASERLKAYWKARRRKSKTGAS